VVVLPAVAGAAGSLREPGSKIGAAAQQRGIRWTACGSRLECARVHVPLDWRHRRGRTIRLAVIRHLASHPEQRIGSLFVNPGGPGDSGVRAVVERGESLDALTQGRFDVVGWDIRGSGASTRVSCFTSRRQRARFWEQLPVPTTRADERRYLAKTVGLAKRCGALDRGLLAHISTADTVRDLDHLRRLVGDRQLTFLGESAGTFIGQTYANIFPRRVRAMALDGVVDPVAATAGTASAVAATLTDTDEVFRQFVATCQAAGPVRCALAVHGSVAPTVDRLLRRLRRAPIPARSAPSPGKLTYGEALTVIKLLGVPAPVLWPELARQLEAAVGGDGSALKTTARLATDEEFRRALEPEVAIVCADSPARQNVRAWPRVVHRLAAISRIGGPVLGWLIGAPCASWPARSADRYTGPWSASTPNPILLVGTSFDPNTPLVNATRAQRRLGNAVLLTHDGYGHLSSADPSICAMQAIGSYLVGLATPAPGTVCPSDRLPFDPNFLLPPM
jgi:pimeloyl-ACP methyl ester carboxylesterase